MKQNIASIVEGALSKPISDLGYELYEVEYVKKQNGMNLTLYIQNEGKDITINDCEKVHRMVDSLLDEINPTNDEPYYLNVSSVGLDKPLKNDKDFRRCMGKVVDVKLFAEVDGQKTFTGKILSFDNDNLVIEVNGQQIILIRKNIAVCKLYIEF